MIVPIYYERQLITLNSTNNNNYRILFYDIETAPSLGWVWQKYQTDVISFENDWYMLSFSYKFEGDEKPTTFALPDFKLYKKDPENDYELVKALHKVISQADLVIGHNSDSFDNRKAFA